MESVELFAGAGGLAMGISQAGFRSLATVEWDRWACNTIRENQSRCYPLVHDWPLFETDVRLFDWSGLPSGIDLLAGGPPCQPFSVGGKHRAFGDHRNMFPIAVEAVRKLAPKSFIFENVKGLTRASFTSYYQYILLQLEFPEVVCRPGECWLDHFNHLQKGKATGAFMGKGLTYHVVPTLVNAADYGVPQKRERIFIVGFRSDLAVEWSFPQPSHSYEALLHSQWISGKYWDRHGIPQSCRPQIPQKLKNQLARLADQNSNSIKKPWKTVRDAICDLPSPGSSEACRIPNHTFQDGARVYPGHTGSPLELPAKTLKAGDHGVPGGENMVVLENGSVRYFTVRESARLQTFPDGYIFPGSWTETMRQLGNAVPVTLSRRVAASVATSILEQELARLENPAMRSFA